MIQNTYETSVSCFPKLNLVRNRSYQSCNTSILCHLHYRVQFLVLIALLDYFNLNPHALRTKQRIQKHLGRNYLRLVSHREHAETCSRKSSPLDLCVDQNATLFTTQNCTKDFCMMNHQNLMVQRTHKRGIPI